MQWPDDMGLMEVTGIYWVEFDWPRLGCTGHWIDVTWCHLISYLMSLVNVRFCFKRTKTWIGEAGGRERSGQFLFFTRRAKPVGCIHLAIGFHLKMPSGGQDATPWNWFGFISSDKWCLPSVGRISLHCSVTSFPPLKFILVFLAIGWTNQVNQLDKFPLPPTSGFEVTQSVTGGKPNS